MTCVECSDELWKICCISCVVCTVCGVLCVRCVMCCVLCVVFRARVVYYDGIIIFLALIRA